jgi:hypothetical protein
VQVRAGNDDAEKAIGVCWLLHLVGDLHQPLHAVSYYDEEHPNGDKGGNGFFVRAKEGGAVINLHQFWDCLLGNDQKYRGAGNLAIELRNRPDFARDKLKELGGGDPAINTRDSATDAWCKESMANAEDVAYAGDTQGRHGSRRRTGAAGRVREAGEGGRGPARRAGGV